ncbi:hypothetical protein JRO89_XS04G0062300 [Xanthoceras sorbifolium]|uniref:PROP1-like PPR domain-containing protein n=1 Tax=Xanthoceras sorbifolium TaxID=99658 RepID=A0ABQ8I4E8_9ROSI|nr:hypothetical protein JRO89_XS04G0062300 [Xanthoceras sorbifolium]
MESLKWSSVVSPGLPCKPSYKKPSKTKQRIQVRSSSRVQPDPWSLSDGNDPTKPKPRSKNPKNPLSDDNARRIIKGKAQYLSVLRRNQGPRAMTPKWIKRTPEQMVKYLQDDRNGHLYGRHVVAAIKAVRAMDENVNVRLVMSSFVAKLSFRDMCVVLKEQKSWRQAANFFAWMKLQLSYRPSVIVYTILLRIYGQVGKIKLAEQTFLEMLEAGCEPDEVACGTMLCTYARWGRHKAMLTFYSAVQERGIIPSTAVFNFMLSSLHKKSFHGMVIDLWRQMVDKGVVRNSFTYTVVISSLVKEGLHEEALKTFYEMKNTGFAPEEVTYSQLISLSTKNGKWDEALKLYEDMKCQGIVPSNYTCASLLTLYYKKEDYSKALSLFSEMEKYKIAADEVIYGLLIRIYGKLGLYEDAQKMFEETEQLGILGDEKTYLAMAQVHLNYGNVGRALNVIGVMKSRNIWFSRFAYIVLLQCNVMKEDLGPAEVAFQALSKTGLPDAGSCNDMLNLYIKLDLTEKAKAFIGQIRKYQFDFDHELYKTVMKVYCNQGMLIAAKQLTEEMGKNGSFKDNKFIQTFSITMHGEYIDHEQNGDKLVASSKLDSMALGMMLNLYLIDGNFSKMEEILKLLLETAGGSSVVSQVISNFIRKGDISKVKILYNQLMKLGCRLEDEVIASLISLYGKQQRLEEAQDVFKLVVDSSRPGKLILKSIIDAYAKCGKAEEAYSVYKEATTKGQDLDAVAISILVNMLTNCGKHEESQIVVRKSFQDSLDLDTVAYNTFIKAMLGAGKLHFAASIYERMLSLGVPSTIQTYNTMISVYGRSRKLDKALEMFNTARSLGCPLDEKAYMNLISFYGKAGKTKEASLLFSEMQEEGINPGLVSYNIMINVYAAAGLYNEAEKLFRVMQRDGFSPDSFTYLSLIQAYTKSLKYSEAEETINSMQKQGIPPSCSHFNHLLSAFSQAGLITEAKRVFKELLMAGLSPDLACYRTMLKGYMDYGCVEEGIDFFEQVRESIKQDKFILSAAVHLYKYAGKELEAKNILDFMSSLRIPFLNNLEVGLKIKPL